MKTKISIRQSKERAQRIKQLIVIKLLNHIESDEVSIRQIALLTKISQERIGLLLNPTILSLDLIVLSSVCHVLGLRIVVNRTKI